MGLDGHSIDPSALKLAQERVSIKDPEHLQRWLDASGRQYLVFRATELVTALPWPSGCEALMQVIAAYAAHRATIPSGRYEVQEDPLSGEAVQIPIFKSDLPEVEELDRAIRFLTRQMYERNPDWSLESDPL